MHRVQFDKWSNESTIPPSTNVVRCSVKCWIRLTRALVPIVFLSFFFHGNNHTLHELRRGCMRKGVHEKGGASYVRTLGWQAGVWVFINFFKMNGNLNILKVHQNV